MSAILILGATGNVGSAVIKYLLDSANSHTVFAGVRNLERAGGEFPPNLNLKFRRFDFEDQSSFSEALCGIELLFLLRPPQISDVDRYIKPLLSYAQSEGLKKVVFLSVQGVELSKMIPHHKIEKLLLAMNFEYVFLRPSYFMQNLTTTLLPEIQAKCSITLPSGDAKFNWVDVENIGEAAAIILTNFEKYAGQAFEITGSQNLSFQEVTAIINETISVKIAYRSVNPLKFFLMKYRKGMKAGFALVMLLLHYLPRFQKEPIISSDYKMVTGKDPATLESFIQREKLKLTERFP